jgi:hypothetical protein
LTKKGIHGNEDCNMCGACCTYFKILDNEGNVFKEADTPCQYLSYDIETREANCEIYNDPKKPTLCSEYHCSQLEEGGWGKIHREGLLKLVS